MVGSNSLATALTLVAFIVLGGIIGLLVLENLRLRRRLKEETVRDALTGLYNRKYLYQRLEEETIRAQRYGTPLAFVMLDLDDFKRCNDSYGHLAGDMVLKKVAQGLLGSVRSVDIAGRFGGEEFAVILPQTGMQPALLVAERLREAIAQTAVLEQPEGGTLRLTVSVGVAVYPDSANSSGELIEEADQALYASKALGKNRVSSASPRTKAIP